MQNIILSFENAFLGSQNTNQTDSKYQFINESTKVIRNLNITICNNFKREREREKKKNSEKKIIHKMRKSQIQRKKIMFILKLLKTVVVFVFGFDPRVL